MLINSFITLLTISYNSILFPQSILDTLASLLFLKYTNNAFTSTPLYWASFPLPGMIFLQISYGSYPFPHISFKCKITKDDFSCLLCITLKTKTKQLLTIFLITDFWIYCLSPSCSPQGHSHFCSLLYLQHLVYSRHSISICWVNGLLQIKNRF